MRTKKGLVQGVTSELGLKDKLSCSRGLAPSRSKIHDELSE